MESNIQINVEFLAGTSIEDATKEARQKARQWNVAYVVFNFNGIRMSIGQNADMVDVLRQYEKRAQFIIAA